MIKKLFFASLLLMGAITLPSCDKEEEGSSAEQTKEPVIGKFYREDFLKEKAYQLIGEDGKQKVVVTISSDSMFFMNANKYAHPSEIKVMLIAYSLTNYLCEAKDISYMQNNEIFFDKASKYFYLYKKDDKLVIANSFNGVNRGNFPAQLCGEYTILW